MGREKRVLMVEDIPGTLRATVDEVRQMGHEVTECLSVAGAVAALNATDFDLMILDWRIPEGDGGPVLIDGGAVLLDAVRQGGVRAQNSNVPYVVVSGQISTVDRRALDGPRCLGVVGKLSLVMLETVLREALGTADPE
jgi:CheY-like chemotaxis protein